MSASAQLSAGKKQSSIDSYRTVIRKTNNNNNNGSTKNAQQKNVPDKPKIKTENIADVVGNVDKSQIRRREIGYEEKKARPKSVHKYARKHPPFEKFRMRPNHTKELESLDANTTDINFYFMSANYSYQKGVGTIIHAYGNMETTFAPIHLQISSFDPYFLIRKPVEFNDNQMIQEFVNALSGGLASYIQMLPRANKELLEMLEDCNEESPPIVGWSIIIGEELVEYKGEDDVEFIKIGVKHPKLVKMARDLIEFPDGKISVDDFAKEKLEVPMTQWCPPEIRRIVNGMRLFEADVDFIIRFLVDNYFRPCSWFNIPAGSYNIVYADDPMRTSRCNLEIALDYGNIIPLKDDYYEKLTPNLTRLTFDIECSTTGTRFPDPERDTVLQIAIVAATLLKTQPKRKYLFALGKVPPIDGCDYIFSYETEEELLDALREFFLAFDPDQWMHHNGNGFDIKYIMARANALGLRWDYAKMGRSLKQAVYCHSSKNKGFLKWSANVPGVLNVDIYRKAQEDPKLEEHNLRYLAVTYLKGITKGEVHYSLIAKYQETPDGRHRLGTYCIGDSWATDEIGDVKKYPENALGMARMTNVPAQTAQDRAQGAKIEGKLRLDCSLQRCKDPKCDKLDCIHPKKNKKFMITTKQVITGDSPIPYWEREMEIMPPEQRNGYMKEWIDALEKNSKDPEHKYKFLNTRYKRHRSKNDNNNNDNKEDDVNKKHGNNKRRSDNGRDKKQKRRAVGKNINGKDEIGSESDESDGFSQDDQMDFDNHRGESIISSIRRDSKRFGLTDDDDDMLDNSALSGYNSGKFDAENVLDDMFEDMAVLQASNLLDEDDGYDGATVLKPKCGYYRNVFTITLDFAGMYPSIIMERNLCFSTLVSNDTIRRLGLKPSYYDENGEEVVMDYWRLPDYTFAEGKCVIKNNPNNPAFLTAKYKKGILPILEEDLGRQRGVIKKQIAELELKIGNISKAIGLFALTEKRNNIEKLKEKATKEQLIELDESKKAIKELYKTAEYKEIDALEFLKAKLDIDQNVIKGIQNSIYGSTGDRTSKYYCKPIATTVTGKGRTMIGMIKDECEKNFNKANGWWFDTEVIYGDTDSIFVVLWGFCQNTNDPQSRAEACSVGRYIADWITKKCFKPPIKLEFEKVYDNLNLIGPKNYFGRKWMINELDAKMDVKGLQMIKRGPCQYIKDTCKKAVTMIVMDDDYEGAMKYVASRLDRLDAHEVPIGELIECQKLSKDLSSYGSDKDLVDAYGNPIKRKGAISPYVKLALRQNEDEKRKRAEQADKKNAKKRKADGGNDNDNENENDGYAYDNEKDDEKHAAVRIGDIINIVVVKREGEQKGTAKITKKKGENVEDPLTVFTENIPIDYDYYKMVLNKQLSKILGNVVLEKFPITSHVSRMGGSAFELQTDDKKQEKKDKPETQNVFKMTASYNKEEDLNAKKNTHQKEILKMKKEMKKMSEDATKMNEKKYKEHEVNVHKRQRINKDINAELKTLKAEKNRRVMEEISKRSIKKRKVTDLNQKSVMASFLIRNQECLLCRNVLTDSPATSIVMNSHPESCSKCGGEWGKCTHRHCDKSKSVCQHCALMADEIVMKEKKKMESLESKSTEIWDGCLKCMNNSMPDAIACTTLKCKFHSERKTTDDNKTKQKILLNGVLDNCKSLVTDPSILDW